MKTTDKPLNDSLPPSVLLWRGTLKEPLGEYPARVVLSYIWVLPVQSNEWIAEPKYYFEVARRNDKMNGLIWEVEDLTRLPAKFFEDYLNAIGNEK